MKKILLPILILVFSQSYSQTKYSRPTAMVDIAGGSASLNFGFSLGVDNFVQILLMGGAVYNQNGQNLCATIGWKAKKNRFSFVPAFTYAGPDYQDVSFRIGYSIDSKRPYYLNLLYSSQRGIGMGINIYFTK